MKAVYTTHGSCSKAIEMEIDDGIVHNVRFINGCDGNLKGISSLVEGMSVNDVVKRLRGIRCGMKNTSCPDQLAQAIEAYLDSENK